MNRLHAYLLLIGLHENVHPIRMGAVVLAALAVMAYLAFDLIRPSEEDQ